MTDKIKKLETEIEELESRLNAIWEKTDFSDTDESIELQDRIDELNDEITELEETDEPKRAQKIVKGPEGSVSLKGKHKMDYTGTKVRFDDGTTGTISGVRGGSEFKGLHFAVKMESGDLRTFPDFGHGAEMAD